jgi:hypothetical protein
LKETIRLKIVKTEKHIILEYLFKHVKMYNFIDLGILIFDESKFNIFLLLIPFFLQKKKKTISLDLGPRLPLKRTFK